MTGDIHTFMAGDVRLNDDDKRASRHGVRGRLVSAPRLGEGGGSLAPGRRPVQPQDPAGNHRRAEGARTRGSRAAEFDHHGYGLAVASKNDFRCTLKRVKTVKKRGSQALPTGRVQLPRQARAPQHPLGARGAGSRKKWTVHPSSKLVPGRARRTSAPARLVRGARTDRLRLLPPGSDLVHERSPRGTRPSTPLSGVLTPRANPSDGNSAPLERIVGDRAPLPPRLARSTAKARRSAARASRGTGGGDYPRTDYVPAGSTGRWETVPNRSPAVRALRPRAVRVTGRDRLRRHSDSEEQRRHKHLRHNAVTSAKVKNGALVLTDFRASARTKLHGKDGCAWRGRCGGRPGTHRRHRAAGPRGTSGQPGPAGRSDGRRRREFPVCRATRGLQGDPGSASGTDRG